MNDDLIAHKSFKLMHRFSIIINTIINSLDRISGPFGGAKRDRTADLLHAMQALSQLSYSPYKNKFFQKESIQFQLFRTIKIEDQEEFTFNGKDILFHFS